MDLHTKNYNQQNACNTFTSELVITSPTYTHVHLIPFDSPGQLDFKASYYQNCKVPIFELFDRHLLMLTDLVS